MHYNVHKTNAQSNQGNIAWHHGLSTLYESKPCYECFTHSGVYKPVSLTTSSGSGESIFVILVLGGILSSKL